MSWQLTSFLILGGALALGFAWYERSRPPARVLALVAALAALAVVGRLAFAPFPNVKPTTDIVLFAGYALGGAPGFAVGAVTALVSNIFFSHGPWTPWQMAAWGGVGMAGGALGALVRGRGWRRARDGDGPAPSEPRELGRWPLALACGLAGLGFGIVMDLYLWTLGAEQTVASYVALSARSLPFNVAHIVGNVVFCLLIGPPLVRALRRYRRRCEVRWAVPRASAGAPVRGGVPTGLVALGLALACGGALGAPTAEARPASGDAARYLLGSQNGDGGFGRSRGDGSREGITGETALGLAAAGRNPRDVKRGDRSVSDYIKSHLPSKDDTGGLERTILVLRAAGLSPHRFAGRNLYRDLVRRRDGDKSFGGRVNHAAFGVFALRAAGASASSGRTRASARRLARASAEWLNGHANKNGEDKGGFGFVPNASSDADNTGAVLQALAAAGLGDGQTAHDAVDYLKKTQETKQPSAGGFRGGRSTPVNAQSTAWAVQGLVAVGQGGDSTARKALSYLRSLQSPADGSIRYSRTSGQTPVWVTGQVLVALRKKVFPLDPVPLRPAAAEPEKGDRPAKKTGDDGSSTRASGQGSAGGRKRSSRTRARGSGPGSGGGAGAGSGAGPGPGSRPGPGDGAAGFASSLPGALPSSFAIGSSAPTSAALAAARGLGALAGAPPTSPGQPPKTAGQLFSDTRGAPSTPVAASKPLGPRRDNPAPRIGAGALLVVLVAGGLLLATGGGARARRLWAVARRRTT
jgi:energy-coupling factor transport system substrate-specific component